MELPGKRWLLKTIDEMSRFRLGWEVCLSQTAEAAAHHVADILKRMGRAPLVWKFDHGSQFMSDERSGQTASFSRIFQKYFSGSMWFHSVLRN
jgi:transposase InsO family protein